MLNHKGNEEVEQPMTVEEFQNADKAETRSVKRSVLYNEGFDNGYKAAGDDFHADKVRLDLFGKRTAEDITDFYTIGFDVGYLRRLAEIGVMNASSCK